MPARKLPEFDSIGDLIEFFEAHDMGEYDLPEARFDVDIRNRTYLIAVDRALMKKLSHAAEAQDVSTEALVQMWLEEKVAHAA